MFTMNAHLDKQTRDFGDREGPKHAFSRHDKENTKLQLMRQNAAMGKKQMTCCGKLSNTNITTL